MELSRLRVRSIMEPDSRARRPDHIRTGEVRTEVVDDHILVMTVDRVAKKNAFTPKIMGELGAALTRLDDDPDLFVGVLDVRRRPHDGRVGDAAVLRRRRRRARRRRGAERGRSVRARRRLPKPLVTAVQGITFTIGIEIALAGDIVVAASDARFCQLEPKRGLAPLGGATIRYVQRAGWGNAMYHLLRADEFSADEALPHRPRAGGRRTRRAGRPGDRAGPRAAAVLAAGAACTRSPTPDWRSTRTSRRRSRRSRRWPRRCRPPTTSRRASRRSSSGARRGSQDVDMDRDGVVGVAPNELTASDHRDPIAGTPYHKHVPARFEPLPVP